MRKNILIFCHGYATQFIDINNQYTSLFDPKHYEVTVAYLTGKPNDTIKQRHHAENILFIDSPAASTRGLKWVAIKQMLALQKEKRFDIVICHRYKPTYVMLFVSRFYKIPVLFSVMHELKTMKSLTRRLTILTLAQPNFIMAGVSNAVRDDLRKDVWGIPNDRIITLYNGIDVQRAEPGLLSRETARERLNLPSHAFIFGTVGRLAVAKDQTTLIDAFAVNKAHFPNAKLVLAGVGELEEPLKKQAEKLGIANDVIFTGFIPEANQYMKAFNVFVLPSIKEAFGLVLLEAMLAKIPVIATRVNGIPEVLGDTGYLIPPKDISALTKQMLTFYQLPAHSLVAAGDKGYQRAVQQFSFDYFKKLFWKLPILKIRNLNEICFRNDL